MEKCTYQGRYQKSITLLRLDIGAAEHTNPDGTMTLKLITRNMEGANPGWGIRMNASGQMEDSNHRYHIDLATLNAGTLSFTKTGILVTDGNGDVGAYSFGFDADQINKLYVTSSSPYVNVSMTGDHSGRITITPAATEVIIYFSTSNSGSGLLKPLRFRAMGGSTEPVSGGNATTPVISYPTGWPETSEMELVDEQTLTADSEPAWYYQWTEQPAMDSQGHVYQYYVVEIPPDNTSHVEYTRTVDEDGTHVTIKNTPDRPTTGSLEVRKLIGGNAANTTKNFNFTVTARDGSGIPIPDGTYGQMTFEGGESHFPLTNNETKRAEDLPEGTVFTVSEDNDGYQSSRTGSEDGDTIVAGDTKYVTITNTLNTWGDLKLEKTVSGLNAEEEKAFTFNITLTGLTEDTSFTVERVTGDQTATESSITFQNATAQSITLTHNESITIKGLPNGLHYDIAEIDYSADNYTAHVTGNLSGDIVGASGTNSLVTITVENEHTVGNLVIEKHVTGENPETSKDFHFTVELEGHSGSETFRALKTVSGADTPVDLTFMDGVSEEILLKDSEKITILNLPNGTVYTVTEAEENKDGYRTTCTVTSSVDSEVEHGTISTGETETVSYTNTRIPTVNITATKAWNGESVLQPTAVRFELFIIDKEDEEDVEKNLASSGLILPSDLVNPQHIVANTGWTNQAVWNNLPKYVDETAATPVPVRYIVKETGVYFGTLEGTEKTADIEWVETNLRDAYTIEGETEVEINSSTNSGAAVISNTPKTVELKVDKTWDPALADEKYTWSATFNVITTDEPSERITQFRIGSDTSEDEPHNDITIWNDSTDAQKTIIELPKYRVIDGELQKITYTAVETAYSVWYDDQLEYSRDGDEYTPDGANNYVATTYPTESGGNGNQYVTVTNRRPTSEFKVRKKWIDVLNQDLKELPTVYFKVKYYFNDNANDLTNHSNWYDAEINGETGTEFALGPDNQPNAWEWICPVDLPSKIDGRDVTYFVEEVYTLQTVDDDANQPCAKYDSDSIHFTEGFEEFQKDHIKIVLNGYENSDGDSTKHWQYPYQAGLDGKGQETVSGIITIRNTAPSVYLQFDIKKKFMEYAPDGALWTVTSFEEMQKGLVLEVQLYRRIIEDLPLTINGFDVQNTENYHILQDFTIYGDTMFVGYDEDGKPVAESGNNPFRLRRGVEGPWHWTVDNTTQDRGLPRFGILNGTPVRYEYLLLEVGTWANQYRKPLDYTWIAHLAAAWDGIERGGIANEIVMFPRFVWQDQDRIGNVKASNLKITKQWQNVSANNQKVLIKLFRTKDREYANKEDYTEKLNTAYNIFIDDKYKKDWIPPVGSNLMEGALDSNHIYVDLDTQERYIVLTGSESVTIDNVPESYTPSQPYLYWIEEVGYLDADGNPHYANPPFKTSYDAGATSKRVELYHAPDPVVYPISPAIGIWKKNNNELIVKNTVDNGSLKIKKNVQLNGTDTTDSQLNGTYIFTVVSGSGVLPAVNKTVAMTFVDGNVTATIKDTGSKEEATPLTVTDDGTVQINNLPLGGYTVTEDDSDLTNGIHLVDKTPVTLTLVKDATEIPTAEFTNNKPYVTAKPEISKKLNGKNFNGKDKDGTGNKVTFKFTLTQVRPVAEGEPYKETVESGDDGNIVFSDIEYTVPNEYIYRITETGGSDMVYDSKEIYARIVVSGTETLTASAPEYFDSIECNTAIDPVFSNTEYGELNLKKLVVTKPESTRASEAAKTVFAFTIKLDFPEDVEVPATLPVSIDNGEAVEHNVTTDENGGSITVELKKDEKGTITKLPVGTKYEIEETDAPGYTLNWTDSKGNEGTISTVISEAEATNTLNETDVKLIKIDSKTKEQISGATFQLKKYDGNDYVDDGGPIIVNGEYLFEDLLDGDYQLVEIDVPAGYIKQDITISFSIADGTVDYEDTPDDLIDYEPAKDENPAAFTVSNIAGAELPSTGGSGTLIYTIAGMALIVLAGVLLVSRRKRRT